jgi:hypothetical protein
MTPLKATDRFTSLTIIGMTKIMCNTNCQAPGVSFMNESSGIQRGQLFEIDPQTEPLLARCPWYKDVIYFL